MRSTSLGHLVLVTALGGVAISGGIVGCGSRQPGGTQEIASSGPRTRLSAKDIYQQSSGAIVRIDVTDPHGARVGTGFIVDRTGLVATNLHVVGGSDKIKIKLGNGHEYDVHEIVGYDKNRDLALLRIQVPAQLPVIRLGDSDQLIPGDQVVAIGNPLGVFENTVSAGLISSVRVFCTPEQAAAQQCPDTNNIDLKYLQISAPISQGSSGGPLFNQFGEVVGVTTGIIEGGQAINIAVPTNYLKTLLARPGSIAVAQFASETKAPDENTDEEPAQIVRNIPPLTDTVFDGCGEPEIKQLVGDISAAIDQGAPLYNTRKKAGYEACFGIYTSVALQWQRQTMCKGVGAAFEGGLERAKTLKTFNEKAWALRDVFDVLLGSPERPVGALQMWAQKHVIAPPPSTPPPPPVPPKD